MKMDIPDPRDIDEDPEDRSRQIRILLADDHALLRAGIRSLLRDLDGFEVVGEAADGNEAVRLIESLEPDVALIDVSMPGMTGLEVAAYVGFSGQPTKVIIVSMHKENAFVQHSIRAGAVGYLLKDCGTSELELAIRAVIRGEIYLSPSISCSLATSLIHGPGGRAEADRRPLTQRQSDILRLIAEGTNTKSIAGRLGISAKTVETHRAQIMERLDIHDVAGLVRYAIRMGMITSEA